MSVALRALGFAGAASVLSSCGGGIGDGSTIQSLTVQVQPIGVLEQGALLDKGTATERYRMYDCFCSTAFALAKFTDETLANFSYRTKWSSSDPSVVQVLNAGESTDLCPLTQQGPGLLVPKSTGSAVITIEFAGLSDTFPVEVVATDPSTFTLKPFDTENAGEVAVGGFLGLRVDATLDNIPRLLNGNVMEWSFTNPDDTVAKVDTVGTVFGLTRSATPLTAQAAFGTCNVTAQADIRVGDIVEPIHVENQPGLASDQRLAINSNENMKATAPLDFDGDGAADGEQVVSEQSTFDYTDVCTKRSYLAGGDGSTTLTDCHEEVANDCASTMPLCPSSQSSCPSGMEACRTELSPLIVLTANFVIARNDTGTPTSLFTTFPRLHGAATTLTAAIGASDTSLTVAALTGYPELLPFEAVLESADASRREVIRVTAATGTTLTVERGIAGTTAQAHASGATFEQRSFGSDTTDVTATDGTLTTVTLESAPTTINAFETLQLQALGHFEGAINRDQRVTQLSSLESSAPTMQWRSSDSTVAFVGFSTGLVTSTNACGGTIVVRARATSSTRTDDVNFAVTTDPLLDMNDGQGNATPNGNADTNDTACVDDPLCDQMTLTIAPASPLPGGVTCN